MIKITRQGEYLFLSTDLVGTNSRARIQKIGRHYVLSLCLFAGFKPHQRRGEWYVVAFYDSDKEAENAFLSLFDDRVGLPPPQSSKAEDDHYGRDINERLA